MTHTSTRVHSPTLLLRVFLAGALLAAGCKQQASLRIVDSDQRLEIQTEQYTLCIEKTGFRYEFLRPDGTVIVPAHTESGLQIGTADSEPIGIQSTEVMAEGEDSVQLKLVTIDAKEVLVTIWPGPQAAKIKVRPVDDGDYTIIVRTGEVRPAYGLGDHAGHGVPQSVMNVRESVEVTGMDVDYKTLYRRSDGSIPPSTHRMISNFAIFPRQGMALVNVEPKNKIFRFLPEENVQGSEGVREMPALYYLFGTPREIYQAFLEVRNKEGYPVMRPKYQWFGVGWEAWGALGINTNHITVKENINKYLADGYPLRWMVVGSGFWPSKPDEYAATTSFGMWDEHHYPNPKAFIEYFHQKGLLFHIGLRIGFTPGGPFTQEGLENGYYLKDDDGKPRLFRVGIPNLPVYVLDAHQPDAVDWYVALCKKWLDDGVDGFKEDLFKYDQSLLLRDDFVDPVNQKLMEQGVYIMGRNAYLGSVADIHRYNDFNFHHPQDRGPINGLALAYSGFPNVYPDIVGGWLGNRYEEVSWSKKRTYLIRYAQYASLNPSMAFGYGPWNFDEEANALCLRAARLHDRLLPHIYSNAIRAYQTGFPYTMTPLPLAYPHDANVYGLADTVRRSYEWLIGESLLAAPLYGDDYATAFSRDIYLPEGTWMDYDDGTVYDGGQTLENYPIPIEKTPLFVGGTGFVVEQEEGKLFGRLYPINPRSETLFWHTDGETQSTVSVDVQDWNDLTVTDLGQGEAVTVEKVRHAWQFELKPGRDYRIQ